MYDIFPCSSDPATLTAGSPSSGSEKSSSVPYATKKSSSTSLFHVMVTEFDEISGKLKSLTSFSLFDLFDSSIIADATEGLFPINPTTESNISAIANIERPIRLSIEHGNAFLLVII